MKRKNQNIKSLRANGVTDWRGYAQSTRLSQAAMEIADGASRETQAINPNKSANEQNNKDMPAFVPGGGSGCVRHRKAKTFARTMGRAMRRRR